MYISNLQDVYAKRKSAKKQQANIGVGSFLSNKQKRKGAAAWQIVIDFCDDIIDMQRQKTQKNKKSITNHDDDCNAGIIYPNKINVIDYELVPNKLNQV